MVGPGSGGGRGAERPVSLNDSEKIEPINGKSQKNAHPDAMKITPYLPSRSDSVSPLVAEASDA